MQISKDQQRKILLLNGPNLNLLGEREVHIYGELTLSNLESRLIEQASKMNAELTCYQSNHEGDLIDWIQSHRGQHPQSADGVIINPGGYSHTSVAIRDALKASQIPCVEIHISQLAKREHFRHHSMISEVVIGTVSGFGTYGYELALLALLNHLNHRK